VAFLAVYLGTWLFLELAVLIRFSSPQALALLAVTPWFWWMHAAGWSGLGRGRAVVALLVRLLLVGAFVMLLAGPRAVRTSDTLSVMYALDLSDSIGEESQDAALSYVVKTVSEKPKEYGKDEAGLVVFGRDAAVELPPRTSFPLEAVNSRVGKDGTNLERALSLSLACLPDGNQGRVVLVTDGTQTEGDARRVLDEFTSRDVAVDVLPISYAFDDEVWLEKLLVPRFVRIGETYEASVVLSSLRAGGGKLTLTENGERIFEQEVEFDPGKNRYTLPLYLRGAGFYEYVATIEVPPDRDGWLENNVAVNQLYLKGKGRTLVVMDPQGDPRDWRTFVEALREAGKAVEVSNSYEFPREPLALMPHDCIVFVNVAADAFDSMQLACLRDAVYSQGSGFLMVGGKNSFGPGGYHHTPVEEALPVTMDVTQKKVLPKGALAVILHTCEFAEGNTWAKRITRKAIKVLGAKDEVGVLAYDWQAGGGWLFPLTPAGEYEKLVPIINNAVIGDMPDFGTAMSKGLKGLQKSDAAVKHMIIISDGDPSPPMPALVQSFAQAQISISTVAINPHGGQDISVMQAIAGATGGRYYFPKDPSKLPSIFIKEAKTLKRSMIQNKTFTPEAGFPSPIMKGMEAVPQLRGYVVTTPRARSSVILEVPRTEDVEPVLATWRFGTGKTAAFTSDLSPNWGAAWVGWARYRAFVEQLVTDISRVEQESNLRVRSSASGSTGMITVEDYNPEGSFLEISARVTDPGGRALTVRLKQTGPRRYEGRFPLRGKGRYQVMAVGTGDGRNEQALGGFAVPYSPEYLRFRSDPIVLRAIAERTGGRMLTGEESGADVFGAERKPRESSRSVEDWFLIVLACLVPLDVAVRRVQIDLSVIAAWLTPKRGKEGASGKTLGALLKRKRSFGFDAGVKVDARPPSVPTRAKAARPGPAAKDRKAAEKPARAKPDATDPATLSTTERLLRLKRKWKSDEDEGS
jgi:uncharacterized membrane protein/Mg-chelatase subunit ChlD